MTDTNLNAARVLVVDDDVDAASSLAVLLRLSGYRVATASDGEGALVLMGDFKPHCVLLDIHMPGIGGLGLSRRLRADYPDDLVLIALTGYGPGDPGVAATFDLVDHHLRKPVDMSLLAKALPPVQSS